MNREIENYEKLILELTDLDIQTNGKLNDTQRVQLELYKKIYILLKLNNNLKEEINGVREAFRFLQKDLNAISKQLKDWDKLDLDNLLVVIRNIEKIIKGDNLESKDDRK